MQDLHNIHIPGFSGAPHALLAAIAFAFRRRSRYSSRPMAKARAIVKRRKAVRNIKKITKTMQMIATAKFQKSLKRATASKPYSIKVREMVADLAASIGDIDHPLLRRPTPETKTSRIAL